jgi:MerR family transcriptional regulator, copper efflux regulator
MLPPGANLSNLDNKCKGSSVSGMRVGDAARQVGTLARMLRYAEELGLVTPVRTPGGYRDDGERDLDAAAYALELQARHRVIPAALAFGLRVLEDPEVAESLRRLARLRSGLDRATALDFETAKARRLLRLAS